MLEGSPKLGQRAARSAAKEASDRRGLFGDSGSSSSRRRIWRRTTRRR